jgi:hypothetical protein
VRSNPTRNHRGLVVSWKEARAEDPVQQEVLSVDASFIRSQLCEWMGPVPDCIVGSREGDGDFNLPTVLGDRAVHLWQPLATARSARWCRRCRTKVTALAPRKCQ